MRKMTNPNRSFQGGDVPGTAQTCNGYGQGNTITVAKASYAPGYDVDTTLGDFPESDLNRGFTFDEYITGGGGKVGGNQRSPMNAKIKLPSRMRDID